MDREDGEGGRGGERKAMRKEGGTAMGKERAREKERKKTRG